MLGVCVLASVSVQSMRGSSIGQVTDILKLPGFLTKGNQKAKCRIKPKWKAESNSNILNVNTGEIVPDSFLGWQLAPFKAP